MGPSRLENSQIVVSPIRSFHTGQELLAFNLLWSFDSEDGFGFLDASSKEVIWFFLAVVDGLPDKRDILHQNGALLDDVVETMAHQARTQSIFRRCVSENYLEELGRQLIELLENLNFLGLIHLVSFKTLLLYLL